MKCLQDCSPRKMWRVCSFLFFICSFLLIPSLLPAFKVCSIPESTRSLNVKCRVTPQLIKKCYRKGLQLGAPVYIRIIKQSRELELWMQSGGTFRLFNKYKICAMSGRLGPKLRQGDRQAPEGCYTASIGSLNPKSRFHLALDVGYPNKLDRTSGCTGNAIMIHGSCVSWGCFAMTDQHIEEIYTLVSEALHYGQGEVPIHIFPFHLTSSKLRRHQSSPCYDFWQRLQPIYQTFESTRVPPLVEIKNNSYMLANQVCREE